MLEPRFLPCGDAALTVEFGDAISHTLLARVKALDAVLADQAIDGLIEAMPTFRSLTLFFDPVRTDARTIEQAVRPLLERTDRTGEPVSGACWRLPVCYGGVHGPDLEPCASALGMRADALVQAHLARAYRVYMLGFLPGFPFMGDLDPALHLPRRSAPRVRVARGSVAIANGLTAIYPAESPGGWHLLGRCPVPLFDVTRSRPSLLAPGDEVRFFAVDVAAYGEIEAGISGGRLDPSCWWDGEGRR